MAQEEHVFKCKDCGAEVVYEPRKVTVFREGVAQREAAPAGSVIRVYLVCPNGHTHEYKVQT